MNSGPSADALTGMGILVTRPQAKAADDSSLLKALHSLAMETRHER